jgi:bacillithiol biosynthesis deacetylase BshB1
MSTRGDLETRAREAAEGAARLGAKERINLGMNDGILKDSMEIRAKLVETIRRYRPTIVLTHHWKDLHPDHSALGRMIRDIMYPLGFEKYPAGGEPYRPNAFLFYQGHLAIEYSFIVDTSGYFDKKTEAIRSFASQLHNPKSSERPTGISQPDFLKRVEARDRYFGRLIDKTYGEPFQMLRAVPMDDPVTHFAPFIRV